MFIIWRLLLWLGLLCALGVLAIGPRRLWNGIKRSWSLLMRKRLDPQEILTQVVQQHQDHVKAVRAALAQAEAAEIKIRDNLAQSEEHAAATEAEARRLTAAGDELGARAALYRINLEKFAIDNFRQQLATQTRMVTESRQRLYLLELQLRQYEVGREILLSQLAQAEKVEEQYAIASQFDPFNAIANWQKAEGLVQEKSLSARAKERVYADTSEIPAAVDPVVFEAQLAELKARLAAGNNPNGAAPPPVGPQTSHDAPPASSDNESKPRQSNRGKHTS